MKYKVSTVDKKSVIEKNFYEKDGKSFHIENCYRWGYFVTEDPVDVEELKNSSELMIYEYDVVDHSFDDGCWLEFYYDDEITEEEREAKEQQELEEFLWRGKMIAKALDAEEAERAADEANAQLADMEPQPDIDALIEEARELEAREQAVRAELEQKTEFLETLATEFEGIL